eukprot:7651373-Pyramimonas_sp.AAC.1
MPLVRSTGICPLSSRHWSYPRVYAAQKESSTSDQRDPEAIKGEANAMYRDKDYASAKRLYTEALSAVYGMDDVLAMVCNVAHCALKLQSFHTGVAAAGACLVMGAQVQEMYCIRMVYMYLGVPGVATP